MSRSTRTVTGIVIAVIVVVLLVVGYIYVSGGSGAPSATLSAPTLAIATATTVPATAAPTATTVVVTQEATAAATSEATAAVTQAVSAVATSEATAEATAAATAASAARAAQSGPVVFNIDSTQSKVSFILNEILNGRNNEVIGTTNQVAGQIAVDFTNPQNSQVGEIRIDVRTLATDSSMRDRVIRGQVLQSAQDQYEFVSFKPTALTGLPAALTLGQPVTFQITGDLTIRTVTKSVTFDATVTPDAQAKIAGTATATIQRGDFNLTIPNVPSVAGVDEAVKLQIDFVALPA